MSLAIGVGVRVESQEGSQICAGELTRRGCHGQRPEYRQEDGRSLYHENSHLYLNFTAYVENKQWQIRLS